MKKLRSLLSTMLGAMATPAIAVIVCQGNCSTAPPNLNVGNSGGGQGSLSVTGGSVLSFGGLGAVGAFGLNQPTGITDGAMLVHGANSTVAVGGVSNSQFWVGSDGGTGVLHLSNQARLSIDAFNNPNGFGDARLYVGRNGVGRVTISDGAELLVRDLGGWGADDDIMIGRGGNNFDGEGHVQVTTGGRLMLSGNSAYLNVARANVSGDGSKRGVGHLTVDHGGQMLIHGGTGEGGLHIARGDNSDGRLIIKGAGSRVDMRGRYTTAWIANDWYATTRQGSGRAELIVRDHGVLSLQSDPVPTGQLRTDMHIGFGLGHAEVTVEGGGRIELANGLKISTDGSTGERKQFGQLTINDTGVVSAGAYTFIGNGDASRISGVLAGTGTLISPRVELRDGGMIAPGNSPGTLNIQGDLTLKGGVLELQVGGLGAGEHDVLNISGALTVNGGTINLAFIDGFLPKAGDGFTLLQAASIQDLATARFSFTGVAAGFQFSLDPNGGLLSFQALNDALPVPEPQTWLLALLGLAGLAAKARLRFRQDAGPTIDPHLPWATDFPRSPPAPATTAPPASPTAAVCPRTTCACRPWATSTS
ncbi:MAG TPA: PEP-CTERM sorting domain-containing protein [Roseateles sp.]